MGKSSWINPSQKRPIKRRKLGVSQKLELASKLGGYALRKVYNKWKGASKYNKIQPSSSFGSRLSNKFSFRGVGSRTLTNFSERQNSKLAISQHNDLSLKPLRPYYFKGKFTKCASVATVRNNNQWVVQGVQGRQVWDFVEVILTHYAFTNSTSSSVTERYKVSDNLFLVNPVRNPGISTVYPNAASVPADNEYLHIKEVAGSLNLLSMSTLPQIVYCYLITPRFDTDKDPVTFMTNVVGAKSSGQDAHVAPSRKAAVSGTYTPGYDVYTNVGFNCWSHKEFRNNWKCLRKFKVILQPGDQHRVSYKFVYNKTVSKQVMQDTRTTTFLKDITVVPMFRVQAGMEGISTDVNTEAADVAYGKPKIGVIHEMNMVLGNLPASRFPAARIYPALVENDTIDFQKVINDVDATTGVYNN